MNARRIGFFLLIMMILLVAVACQSATPEPTPTLVIPTAMVPEEVPDEAPSPVPTPLPDATAVPAPPTATSIPIPTQTPLPQPTATTAPTQPANAQTAYRVAFVTDDDVLNVRQNAGVGNSIVGTFAPDEENIQITGVGEPVAGSTWVPVRAGAVGGWVNSRYLTTDVPVADFCADDAVTALLTEFKTAVDQEDDALLAALIHPERGLRVRYHWWNPEVLLRGQGRTALFSGDAAYDWGIQDGSGSPISGSFATEIVPLLREDFLGATESACNEILSGSTAGLVQLPEGYDALHYYSFYRPAGDESGFDWGTWVVGLEKWNGRYYLSYLVHFDWEI